MPYISPIQSIQLNHSIIYKYIFYTNKSTKDILVCDNFIFAGKLQSIPLYGTYIVPVGRLRPLTEGDAFVGLRGVSSHCKGVF